MSVCPLRYSHSDPRNGFNELRRYLLSLGIDTRATSVFSIPLPQKLESTKEGANAAGFSSLENTIFFELRRLFRTDIAQMNAVVALGRVFFVGGQEGKSIHMQLVLNHKGHGLLEMNSAYHELLQHQMKNAWTPANMSQNITCMEKTFNSLRDFKQEFATIHEILSKHDLLNNHALPTEMQC